MKTSGKSLWAVRPEDRPREKLERLGPAGLSDSELVALVLGSGMPGVNVLDSARSLLDQAGGVQELMGMTVRELKALMGVGVATAGRVVAVAELWRRAHDPPPGPVIERPADVVSAVRQHLAVRSPSKTYSPAHLVITDHELRLRWVVPVEISPGENIGSFVARVLHEVLYRGSAAFAVAWVTARSVGTAGAEAAAGSAVNAGGAGGAVGAVSAGGADAGPGDARDVDPDDPTDKRAIRDVLKLAAATVGLRYLSTLVVSGEEWSAL
ncbi:hypothetical protein BH09ACT6_BH09ACT6_07820 [soil metagenome]